MPKDWSAIDSVHNLLANGVYQIPADSGLGSVGRPSAVGQQGGRTAGLETLWNFFIDNVYDPDEAFQLNPNIEQQLRMHPAVSGFFTKRSTAVAAMPWRCEPNPKGKDKKTALEIADYVHDVLGGIPNWEQCFEMMQQAVLLGGQGIELTWHRDAAGVEFPVQWNPVHKSRFLFDRLNNMALLTRDQAVYGAYVSQDPQRQFRDHGPLPDGKFVYHIHKKGQGSWYNPPIEGYSYFGMGEDVPLYYVITFDVFCLKYRMKFLETYGLPPKRLYVPNNEMTSRASLRILDSLRGESLSTIPRIPGQDHDSLYKVEDVTAPSGSFDYFDSHINGYTKPYTKLILLGDDSSDEKTDGKGYAADVSKRDAGPNVYFKSDARKIGQSLTTQLVPAIVRGRWPNMVREYYPIISLEPKEEKDRKQEAEIIQGAQGIGLEVTKQHAYDALDLPQPKPGDELLEAKQQMPPGMPGQPGQPGMPPGKNGNGAFPRDPKEGRLPVGAGNGSIADN
jgi:hypothetical protein